MAGHTFSASARRFRAGVLVTLGILLAPFRSAALEERVDDLSVSVEVAGVFSLNLDKAALAFNNISPGTTKILGEGRGFNELRCRSNSGRPWYLKAQVTSLRHSRGDINLPVSNLKWKVVESTGSGELMGGGSEFQEFSEQPTLMYASRGDDDRGREVVLHVQYSLTTPPDALAGNYIGQVVFTMAENP